MPKRLRLQSRFRQQVRWLERLAHRIAGRANPDLAQETWARKLAAEAEAEARHPRAFLATIARRIAIDEARKVRTRGGLALAYDDLPEHALPWASPDQETAVLLKQIILGLPPLYRDVFILNRFVGLTYAEIARRQGVSVKTIEYRMSRALALCEAALRD
jgi:RNA polymerase sigma-70 factor (ECF subfamily)